MFKRVKGSDAHAVDRAHGKELVSYGRSYGFSRPHGHVARRRGHVARCRGRVVHGIRRGLPGKRAPVYDHSSVIDGAAGVGGFEKRFYDFSREVDSYIRFIVHQHVEIFHQYRELFMNGRVRGIRRRGGRGGDRDVRRRSFVEIVRKHRLKKGDPVHDGHVNVADHDVVFLSPFQSS